VTATACGEVASCGKPALTCAVPFFAVFGEAAVAGVLTVVVLAVGVAGVGTVADPLGNTWGGTEFETEAGCVAAIFSENISSNAGEPAPLFALEILARFATFGENRLIKMDAGCMVLQSLSGNTQCSYDSNAAKCGKDFIG
jgi:hypothetical protein